MWRRKRHAWQAAGRHRAALLLGHAFFSWLHLYQAAKVRAACAAKAMAPPVPGVGQPTRAACAVLTAAPLQDWLIMHTLLLLSRTLLIQPPPPPSRRRS